METTRVISAKFVLVDIRRLYIRIHVIYKAPTYPRKAQRTHVHFQIRKQFFTEDIDPCWRRQYSDKMLTAD